MKAAAGRPEDIGDIQALAAHLGLSTAQEVLAIVTSVIPDSFPPRSLRRERTS
jgi:hypothetical protein